MAQKITFYILKIVVEIFNFIFLTFNEINYTLLIFNIEALYTILQFM